MQAFLRSRIPLPVQVKNICLRVFDVGVPLCGQKVLGVPKAARTELTGLPTTLPFLIG